MTISQEDALYEFLENVTDPFTLGDVLAYLRMVDPKRSGRLGIETASFINSRNMAFSLGPERWISRRGCFEPAVFVISPTRLELLNGILIPGHRCVPFANPIMLPQELSFSWQGKQVPWTTTEGPPEDFYPYYSIFGEEYAPQYVARDNPENEEAFNEDPYEDPAEVSIRTLDMRNIYRESGFVPGDRFVVRTTDWKTGAFSLERVGKNEWAEADLQTWLKAAEQGFENSFNSLGPGSSTEEQIAFAYWYGGQRIREVPAYSLEDFIYEKTDRFETTAYGIETRFWYSGKEIPDAQGLDGSSIRPDKTMIEEILYRAHIPISEYVIQSYVRDALYRNDFDIMHIIDRIVPPALELDEHDGELLAGYIVDVLEEFQRTYTLFADKSIGPIRQRVGELHTAVIELAARLGKTEIDPSWLPKHTFIVLSQIQDHSAGVMEDLDTSEAPPEDELEAIDNSLDSMIETYEDIKELLDDALNSFRRNKLSVVKGNIPQTPGRLVQISIGGVNVWRRIIIPEILSLKDFHLVIQAALGWGNTRSYKFIIEKTQTESGLEKEPPPDLPIGELGAQEVMELLYEYGDKWTVKIILLSRYEGEAGEKVRCVAGAGTAPPETVEGPLRFRKFLRSLERGNDIDRRTAQEELGMNFDPDFFDLTICNQRIDRINTALPSDEKDQGPIQGQGQGPVILKF
ncbi:hypothetical protein AGMMS49928_26330 [Spirochaetia bacterium]|nr:hypothetical protein AGMMS49928_26330 [Spirochaetia bacterium]